MTAAKSPTRCFKQACGNPPTKTLHPMPGVNIHTCPTHVESADNLARTGRP